MSTREVINKIVTGAYSAINPGFLKSTSASEFGDRSGHYHGGQGMLENLDGDDEVAKSLPGPRAFTVDLFGK